MANMPGLPPGPPPPKPLKAPLTAHIVPSTSNVSSIPTTSSASTSSPKLNKTASSMNKIPDDPREMEKFLSREKMAFFQELEMDRILHAFKLNPYDILECPMEADDKMITKIYRRKSLLIHPDKVKDRECSLCKNKEVFTICYGEPDLHTIGEI